MVNNFTNINKTKQSLNSDGQQFYQYQQNKTINDAITILIVIWDKCKNLFWRRSFGNSFESIIILCK